MATLRNKWKLAAVTRETQEEHPRNGQSRNMAFPRINEEYITQVSEEIENRVTKKLSQEFSRTESRILGALSKLDEFLLNQQIRTHSGTQMWKTRERMRTTPRVILILKQASSAAILQKTLAQKLHVTESHPLFSKNEFYYLFNSAFFHDFFSKLWKKIFSAIFKLVEWNENTK